jgi:hypothetical protein
LRGWVMQPDGKYKRSSNIIEQELDIQEMLMTRA